MVDGAYQLVTRSERGHPSAWLRLGVENAPGRRTAHNVQVLVTRITPLGDAESVGEGHGSLAAMPLCWSEEVEYPLG